MQIITRILAGESNRRGDLFGRLMSDLFLSLGYDNVRLNVARSGREIDIDAEHRIEKRRAVAECRAWADKVGGKEINTFAGKLRAERGRKPRASVTPYFISLSGFTETSIDQEEEAGDEAIILVDGERMIVELVKGRILVPLEEATEQAGKLTSDTPSLTLDTQIELLADERGWTWAIYYTTEGQRSHVVLVHADGTLLSAAIAREVVAADLQADGILSALTCLNTERPVTDDREERAVVLRTYYQYLAAECGFILLDGLPADAEVGQLRLKLENLFVPLQLIYIGGQGGGDEALDHSTKIRVDAKRSRDIPFSRFRQLALPFATEEIEIEQVQAGTQGQIEHPTKERAGRAYRVPVGHLLSMHRRVAVLASPGAGKSTLLKRLAVAYADPSRRTLTDDGLPDRNWIPIFFRCRELRDKARAPFAELLDRLAAKAFLSDHAAAFRAAIDRALRAGEALLLIDGLDEIADAGDRAALVRNLRTLLAIYPGISLVLTSREAGFRHVAGLLASICLHTQLAEFGRDDIRRLTVAWHREVIGDRPEVILEADRLASTISQSDRIRRLAVNPLLLTTLLLVKRWVGHLPTRRTVLYGKAVEVLLMTWNVEAHDPIEQEEALPQLCYVAFAMMQLGIQKVSRPDLARLLLDARKELSAELAFARIGVSEFIEKIENRSSLLIMTGVDIVDGSLVEFYEFRHLTFQEYLTARAVVDGWYPQRIETATVATALAPYLEVEKWREVIPLAAVLAGRKAEPLIAALAQRPLKQVHWALATCLTDEVQATPEVIRIALRALLTKPELLISTRRLTALLSTGKYGALVREEVMQLFLNRPGQALGLLAGEIVAAQIASGGQTASQTHQKIRERLMGTESMARCEALLAFYRLPSTNGHVAFDKELVKSAATCLQGVSSEQLAACLALGREQLWAWVLTFLDIRVELERLVRLWLEDNNRELSKAAQLAIARLPILQRELAHFEGCESIVLDQWLRHAISQGSEARGAACVVAYYRRAPYSDTDLLDLTERYSASSMPWRGKIREVYRALLQAC